MVDLCDLLNWESVGTFLNPPTTQPLFPNLRYLRASGLTEIKIKHFLCMPFPSLISLEVGYQREDASSRLQGSLESFSKFSPNLRRLTLDMHQLDITFINFFSSYICRWQDLHTVHCDRVPLDMDALAHLSRMPALTRLRCMPSDTFPPFDSPIFLANLHDLSLYSESLDPISQLLSRVRLPAIVRFMAQVNCRPSNHAFSLFLAGVQASVIGNTIQALKFEDVDVSGMDDEEDTEDDPRPGLGFEDLQPYMAFSNLRRIDLELSWDVCLTDNELLTLTSAWPHLEQIFINEEQGWGMVSGITPNGLLHLLHKCRSLREIALTINTHGYTEFCKSRASLGSTLPSIFYIDVLESHIEAESVPAIAAFLAAIAPRPNFFFYAHDGLHGRRKDDDSKALWHEAYRRANLALTGSHRS